MKTTGKATQKATKGVTFIARVNKTKSIKALLALIAKVGSFPAKNAQTIRRRRRAVANQFAKFGESVKLNNSLRVIDAELIAG